MAAGQRRWLAWLDAVTRQAGDDPVGEVRRQRQFGWPAHQQPTLFGKKGVVGAGQPRLQRLGAVHAQGGPLRGAQVDPWQQLAEFFLRRGDLLGGFAGNAFGFGDIAAQVPDPLAIGRRVSGHGHARFGAAAQAMGVQRFEARAFGDDHVQRPALHGGLAQPQRFEQRRRAGTGAQDDALGTNLALVDLQADQNATFQQRFDLLTGEQAITGQIGQALDQARHIDHQFCQAIDLALEAFVLQGRRQLLALDLIDTAAHGLAGEEAGEVAGERAGGPEVVGFGQQAHAGQVQFAVTGQRFTPAARHVGNGFRGAGQGAMQRVLGAAVDDALGLHTLPAAEAGAFHQHGRKTLAAQARIQPEAGDTSADNQNVGGNNGWHAATSVFKTRAQYTDSRQGICISCEGCDLRWLSQLRWSAYTMLRSDTAFGSCSQSVFQCPAVLEKSWMTTTPSTINAIPSIAGTSSFCP